MLITPFKHQISKEYYNVASRVNDRKLKALSNISKGYASYNKIVRNFT